MKNSEIGGQAVIEGVMMKNKNQYAVAVRKPDHEIEIKKGTQVSARDKHKIAGVPVIRGVVTFVESLTVGMRTLNESASYFEEEEDKKERTPEQKEKDEKKESILMGLLMVVAVIAAIGIFVAVPFLISEALRRPVPSAQLRGLIEGIIRVVLFVVYVKLISLMEDIKRVFMYHGAEHKTINCVENGLELTIENVKKQNMVHKRCGTSFMLVVMLVSILFFMFIVVGNMWLRMALRVLLIPVIAGISYEFIRFAGSHDGPVINVLSKPGLWLQGLTTKEPDEDMIEVAIASVDAVFDWKKFIAGMNEPEETVAVDSTLAASKEKMVEDKKTETEEDIEIVSIESGDEEDDEILNALDRYFEAPEKEDKA